MPRLVSVPGLCRPVPPRAGTITTQNQTPAWMLAPRGVRRPYLTDPPQRL
ncbi:hypothetical protein R3F72_03990 [Salinicola sp. 4072]